MFRKIFRELFLDRLTPVQIFLLLAVVYLLGMVIQLGMGGRMGFGLVLAIKTAFVYGMAALVWSRGRRLIPIALVTAITLLDAGIIALIYAVDKGWIS